MRLFKCSNSYSTRFDYYFFIVLKGETVELCDKLRR